MRDGLLGHWSGAPGGLAPLPIGGADNDISYLGQDTRGNLLDSVLAGAFWAGGANGQGELRHRGQRIAHVTRPPTAFFQAQLVLVRAYADLRDDRLTEIDAQIDDVLSFFGMVGLLDDTRRKHTLELLAATLRLAILMEMPVKHFCRAPRPMDYAVEVMPMIQTPDHSSFPSGHAMEVHAVATVLHRLMTGESAKQGLTAGALPFRIAQRIATNRTVAGVHFPVDSAAGAVLGCQLGEAIYREICGEATEAADGVDLSFQMALVATGAAAELPETADMTRDWLARRVVHQAAAVPEAGSILGQFWLRAQAEWPQPPAVA